MVLLQSLHMGLQGLANVALFCLFRCTEIPGVQATFLWMQATLNSSNTLVWCLCGALPAGWVLRQGVWLSGPCICESLMSAAYTMWQCITAHPCGSGDFLGWCHFSWVLWLLLMGLPQRGTRPPSRCKESSTTKPQLFLILYQ